MRCRNPSLGVSLSPGFLHYYFRKRKNANQSIHIIRKTQYRTIAELVALGLDFSLPRGSVQSSKVTQTYSNLLFNCSPTAYIKTFLCSQNYRFKSYKPLNLSQQTFVPTTNAHCHRLIRALSICNMFQFLMEC